MIRTTFCASAGLLAALIAVQAVPRQGAQGAAGAVQVDPRPAAAGQAPASSPPSPAIQVEQANPRSTETQLLGVGVIDAPLKELLSTLAQQSGLNLSMPESLNKEVSVNLRDTTLETALDAILTPENLQYRIDGKLLRVFKPQMVDATLNFTYITAVRSRSTSLSASATAGFSGGGAGGLNTAGGGVSGGSSTSVSGSETTDLPSIVDGMVRAHSSKAEGSYVQFNRMLGQFFVRDFPENIARMKSLLDQTQSAAGLQVYIEAKLVEVQLNKTSQFGVNWSAVLGNTVTLSASFAQESAFQASVSHRGFDALLSALTTYGDVNVLSNPTVSTLNGQPAVVRIGTQDVFFVTQTQTDPRTGQILQTAETPATVNEGVVLDVTPNISPDGVIYMNIHPVVTERTGQSTSARGSTVPILDLRESDTAVRVNDGDTIVIAGLISEKDLRNSSKSPLSGIPLIGSFFGRKSKELRKTDLVIMLTPHLFNLSGVSELTRNRLSGVEESKRAQEKESGEAKQKEKK